jgi:TetR/AcrR family transcriptional repressor of nem operon
MSGEATNAVREPGFDDIGAVEIVKRADLTYGGFCARFDFRNARLESAVAAMSVESLDASFFTSRPASDGDDLKAVVQASHLAAHLVRVGIVCLITMLGSDVKRQIANVRTALSRLLPVIVNTVRKLRARVSCAHSYQLALVEATNLVGAFLIKCVASAKAESKKILSAAKKLLLSVRVVALDFVGVRLWPSFNVL